MARLRDKPVAYKMVSSAKKWTLEVGVIIL